MSNFSQYDDLIRSFKKLDFSELLRAVSSDVANTIKIRVKTKGEGVDGNKMAPYSSKYRQFRSKKGRTNSKRDLTFTGRMFQSMTIVGSKINKTITFGATEKAKAFYNNQRTPFFGVGPTEEKTIDATIARFIKGIR